MKKMQAGMNQLFTTTCRICVHKTTEYIGLLKSMNMHAYNVEFDIIVYQSSNLINSHEFIYSHREVSNHNSLPWLPATDP